MSPFNLFSTTTTATTEPSNRSQIEGEQCKTLHYNNNNNKLRFLIVRFFLFTFISNTMLLSVDIIVKPSECNPLNSQLSQQAVSKVIKTTGSVFTATGVSRQKRTHRGENSQHQPLLNSKMVRDNMKFELNNQTNAQPFKTKQKRTLSNVGTSSQIGGQNHHQVTVKRFKTSNNLETVTPSQTSQVSTNNSSLESTMQQTLSNQNVTSNAPTDINNNNEFGLRNQSNSNDVNNNIISVSDEAANQQQHWQRNVSSINGTIDLSQYGQNDVDRLYGDALLVYLKNFNE